MMQGIKLYGGMSIRNSFLIPVICLLYLMSSTGNAIEVIELENFASIEVSKTLISDEENTYFITVSNSGEIELNDVVVKNILPSGVKYINSRYKNFDDPFLSRCLDIGEGGATKNITWMLGSLGTNQSKEIEVAITKINPDATYSMGKIYAEGRALDNLINSSKAYNLGIDVTIDVYEANRSTKALFDIRGSLEDAKFEAYKITVDNFGNAPLEGAILSAKLAKGMKFENTSYFNDNCSTPDVTADPKEFDRNKETNLVWNLGSLAPEEIKSVIMTAYLRPEVNNTAVAVTAAGKIRGINVGDSKNGADIRNCSLRLPNNQPCYVPSNTCKLKCPDWIYSFSPQ